MEQKYFNSLGSLNSYANTFPANSFSVEPSPAVCGCKSVRCAFDVADRQDKEIIETLVICPVCANKPQNNH